MEADEGGEAIPENNTSRNGENEYETENEKRIQKSILEIDGDWKRTRDIIGKLRREA